MKNQLDFASENKSNSKIDRDACDHGLYYDLFCMPKLFKVISQLCHSRDFLLIDEIHKRHPNNFAWRPSIDRLTGTDKVRAAIEKGQLAPLLAEWDKEAAEFKEMSRQFYLY